MRHLLGTGIHALTMSETLSIVDDCIQRRERLLIGVVNAAKLVNMRRCDALRRAVGSADLILADGMGVVWAARVLNRRLPERVTGIDLMEGILRRGHERGYRVYFLGATDDVLEAAIARIHADHPGLVVVGRRNGYFRSEEEPEIVAAIRAAAPDVLLVAMSSPKKEEFLARWSAQLNVPVCHGVGGAFDVAARKVHRAPERLQRLGLEWLYRVVQEPRRLWRRYLVTNALFCSLVLLEFLREVFLPRPTQSGRCPILRLSEGGGPTIVQNVLRPVSRHHAPGLVTLKSHEKDGGPTVKLLTPGGNDTTSRSSRRPARRAVTAPACLRASTHRQAEGEPLRVMLLISNLEYGGAQRQVIELANHLGADGMEAHVVCLSDYVPLAGDLHDQEHRLHVIAKRGKFDVTVVPRLVRLVQRLGVTIVHSFLFDAEIAGRLAGLLSGRVAVVGSERNTDYKRKWRHTAALRLTGRCMEGIVANSHAGKRFQMRTLAIPPERIFVVHNGVDVTRFQPQAVESLRRRFDIEEGAPVVGMFASFKRQKNHAMFFRVARRVRAVHPQSQFLCVGAQLHRGLQASDEYFREMQAAIRELGLETSVHVLGNRSDLVDLYNLCDVTVLTSRREGTPNVLLESMACGVPVVATDVADNGRIVPNGRVGFVVPYDDDAAMADRVLHLLSDDSARRDLGARARRWVAGEFSTGALAKKTVAVYREVLRRRRRRSRGRQPADHPTDTTDAVVPGLAPGAPTPRTRSEAADPARCHWSGMSKPKAPAWPASSVLQAFATLDHGTRCLVSQGAPAVEIRRFPYPYRAMLAICSDLDMTPDRHVYWEIMRFLNTSDTTAMGPGIGLEIGNTIYFDMPPDQFAYWNTDDAGREMVRHLIRSGHIDCLHSYGDLATTRNRAGHALDELVRHDCRLEVWVDHSKAPTNFGADIMKGSGDVPGSPVYHADLTIGYGIRYVWRGRTTSMIGQNASPRLRGVFCPKHPFSSAKTVAKQAVKNALGGFGLAKYAMHGPNRVLWEDRLRDGRGVLEFLRCNPHWRGVGFGATAAGLADVLTEPFLDRLVEREGLCILYTHLGKVEDRRRPFARGTVSALRRLADYHEQGKIMVTTTRRLLRFHRSQRMVAVSSARGRHRLRIEPHGSSDHKTVPNDRFEDDVAGLTMYVADPDAVEVFLGEKPLPGLRRNGPDHTGRKSVSLPWHPLTFPKL